MRSLAEREWFYSQDREELELRAAAPYSMYRLKTTGQIVCEHTMELGISSPIEISLLGDLHFNLCVPEDMQDAESPYTYECRLWGRNGSNVPSADAALMGASFSDHMVVVGDILDFLSHGSMLLTKKHIIDEYPDAIMTIGWHDITKQMQTKRPNLLTDDERIAMLAEMWPHDIHYYKRELCDEIVAICLGQAHTRYTAEIRDRLKADVEEARASGKKIFIFQHEPFATGKPEDREVESCFYSRGGPVMKNFYDGITLLCRPDDENEINRGVYDIVRHSADVIKAIFVGHEHDQTYSEISAKAQVNGNEIDTVIPQHVVNACAYYEKGYYMRITVK